MNKVKKILYNLGFAALLGLCTIPSLLAIHMLANSSSADLCCMRDSLTTLNSTKTEFVQTVYDSLRE